LIGFTRGARFNVYTHAGRLQAIGVNPVSDSGTPT
jgi:hypothetical protein